ncbi:DUF1501 domain-containing protein [Rhizobium helianthi]|uniref:DUF1501 domain-containing protein n=1 Tax=Rhizobium helianthi TaxID=1132695 RepID=A0ABW4LYT0_9HYPH
MATNGTPIPLSRRGFLASAAGMAALPLASRVSFAAVQGDHRFIVILLRGGMDGLDLVQPYGDADFARLRPELALTPATGLLDLDGFYGLHPAAEALMPLWQTRQLSFVHAVATSYRGGQSHIDAQDVLETGSTDVRSLRSGWLNRALAFIPRSTSRKAVDITTSVELIMAGANQSDIWTTQADFALAQDEAQALLRLYEGDAPFHAAMAQALDFNPPLPLYDPATRISGAAELGRLTGSLLKDDYRIASFSLTGWDTHAHQKEQFALQASLLATAINGLRDGMGDSAWATTIVLAMTEFGRSVTVNDEGGTGHGTGSVAVLSGGALQAAQVMADWPGLDESQLLGGRDLAPTSDLRELAAALLHRQFDMTPANLSGKVFPGLNFDPGSRYLRV